MEPTSQSTESPLIFVVRGVGSADADQSLRSCIDLLHAHGVNTEKAQEINWSWSHPVQWPYSIDSRIGSPSDLSRDPESFTVSMEFLRHLGSSFRGGARRSWGADPASLSDRLRSRAFSTLEAMPALLLFQCASHVLGWKSLANGVWLVLACIVLLALVSVVSLQLGHLFARLRVVVLNLLWPAIFILVCPLTGALAIAGGLGSGMVLLTLAIGILPPSCGRSLNDGLPNYDRINEELLGTVSFYILIPLFLYIAWRIYAPLRSLAAPLLKVFSDIVRYAGDPDYQRDLHAEAARGIGKEIRPGARVVFITHSLGTVIVSDLLRSGVVPADCDVFLVTAGSPLKRFFHCFFGFDYPAPRTLAAHFEHRFRSFRWVNIYRPRDPVGGNLGLERFDSSTRQPFGWLKAHLDYWSDPVVHRLAHEGLASSDENRDVPDSGIKSEPRPKATGFEGGGVWWGPYVSKAMGLLAAVALIQVSFSMFFVSPFRVEADAQALREHGIDTLGRLFRYQTTGSLDERGISKVTFDRFVIEFPTHGGGDARVQELNNLHFDVRSLKKVAFEDRSLVKVPQHRYEGWMTTVPVRYLPDHPDIFDVNGARRQQLPGLFTVVGFLMSVVVLPWFGVFAFFGWTLVMNPLVTSYLGLVDEVTVDARQRRKGAGKELNTPLGKAANDEGESWIFWLGPYTFVLCIVAMAYLFIRNG